MGFPVSESYSLPVNAMSLVGSLMTNLCGSHYPLRMAMVDVSSQRIQIEKYFSIPKCVRLARMSHHSHRLLRKILGAVPGEQREQLSEIWREELFDEIRWFYNKKFEEGHDVHLNSALAEDYSKPTKRAENQYVSGVMGIAYNPFWDSEAGNAYMNYEVAELLKFWTEKIIEIDPVERKRRSLRLTLDKIPEKISVPRSNQRVELEVGNGNGMLLTNLGTVWKLLRISWCPHPHASLIEEVTARVRLSPTKDEDLGNLNVTHKLISPHSNLARAEDYSKPTKRADYQNVSGVMGIAYNPFWDSEAGNAYMKYEVAELLKFWTEKIIEIDPVERKRRSLRLTLDKIPEKISVPRSNERVELKVENGNGMLLTNFGTVWKLLRPSWCPHPHACLIEEVTERVRLSPTEDEDLGNLNVTHKLILPHSKGSEEKTSKLDKLAKKMEPDSCLDLMCGSGEHSCDGRSCVKIQSFQKEGLAIWYGDITEKEKSEVQIVAECYTNTTVNIAAALGFFSRMCSLQSLEMLEYEHHLMTALSVESWSGALQITQKHIRG